MGDTDLGVCIKTASDGKHADCVDSQPGTLLWFWEDTGLIPPSATINSVTFHIRHSAHSTFTSLINVADVGFPLFVALQYWHDGPSSANTFIPLDYPVLSTTAAVVQNFSIGVGSSAVMTVNPATSNPWTRAELFQDAGVNGNGLWGEYQVNIFDGSGATYSVDQVSLTVDYSGGGATFPISGVVPAVGPTIGGS